MRWREIIEAQPRNPRKPQAVSGDVPLSTPAQQRAQQQRVDNTARQDVQRWQSPRQKLADI